MSIFLLPKFLNRTPHLIALLISLQKVRFGAIKIHKKILLVYIIIKYSKNILANKHPEVFYTHIYNHTHKYILAAWQLIWLLIFVIIKIHWVLNYFCIQDLIFMDL